MSMINTPVVNAATAEQIARNGGKGLQEDDPPLLRFVEGTVVDVNATEKQGRTVYLPQVKVFIRAIGDTKCETPDIVEGWRVEEKLIEKTRKKKVYRTREVEGEVREIEEEIDERYEESYFFNVPYTPWFDKIKERLHHGHISQRYSDACHAAYTRWKEKHSDPIDGTPVISWNMVNMAQQKNMVDLGVVSIELAAEMNEETMDALGMGAREIKKKAINYLKSSTQENAEIIALRAENAQLREEGESKMSAVEQKLADLQERVENTPKKRGRPLKGVEGNGTTGDDSEGNG